MKSVSSSKHYSTLAAGPLLVALVTHPFSPSLSLSLSLSVSPSIEM